MTTYVFVAPGLVVALPPIAAADYCTLAQLKAALRITTDADDALLSDAIAEASRLIDRHCGLPDGAFGPRRQVRYFDAAQRDVLALPPLVELVSLSTDSDGDGVYETSWAAGDYYLYPRNAALDGDPYRELRVNRTLGGYTLPSGQSAVQIDGVWGRAEVPALIRRACILQASRWFKRNEAVFGVLASMNEAGVSQRTLGRLDPDVAAILDDGRFREWVGVA